MIIVSISIRHLTDLMSTEKRLSFTDVAVTSKYYVILCENLVKILLCQYFNIIHSKVQHTCRHLPGSLGQGNVTFGQILEKVKKSSGQNWASENFR